MLLWQRSGAMGLFALVNHSLSLLLFSLAINNTSYYARCRILTNFASYGAAGCAAGFCCLRAQPKLLPLAVSILPAAFVCDARAEWSLRGVSDSFAVR